MEEEGDSLQFWLHSTSTCASTHRISSSTFFSSTLYMLIATFVVLLLFLLAIFTFPSYTSQILKSSSVNKGWDSLNVLLVFFAIAFGIFARWNEDLGSNSSGSEISVEYVSNDKRLQQTSPPTSSYEPSWYELPYYFPMRATASGSGRLRRNSSSYPDLRQQSDWGTTGGNGFRYYDDFEISIYYQSVQIQPDQKIPQEINIINGEPDAKEIPVDTFLSRSDSTAKSSPLQKNPPSQPPHPLLSPRQKKTRVHRAVPRRERSRIQNVPRDTSPIKMFVTSQAKPERRKVRRDVLVKEEKGTRPASRSSSKMVHAQWPPAADLTIPVKEDLTEPKLAPETSCPLNLLLTPEPRVKWTALNQENEVKPEAEAAPSPPPTPSPTIIRPDRNQKTVKKERKKSSAKKEIAMVWDSIYKRKKKQQQQQQQQQLGRADSGNYNGISQLFSEPEFTSTTQLFPPRSPSPPPPPPPPHSAFHNLFRKAGSSKSKKIQSVPAPPPPPPSPPRQDISRPRTSTGKPPLPKRASNYIRGEHGFMSKSGSESLLCDIPLPPPLPPFGVPETKFLFRGDYAKIKSNASSRSGSPEPYDFDDESFINGSSGGEVARTTANAAFCPSPDVNAKADTFIARLRGEWRLEKMSSVNDETRMGFEPESKIS